MTMHPQVSYLIPAETERVARAAFPKGSPIMRIRDQLNACSLTIPTSPRSFHRSDNWLSAPLA